MKLLQLDILITAEKEICISQDNSLSDDGGEFIYITPEMVDMVCGELQKCKSVIESETKEGK